jgi:hypothetical protein
MESFSIDRKGKQYRNQIFGIGSKYTTITESEDEIIEESERTDDT